MIGWTIAMAVILLSSIVVVIYKWKQRRQASHIVYRQQQHEVEQPRGEAALQLPDSLEHCRKMDHAKASVERIDGELARLNGSKGSVGCYVS
jgi:hypothetical protein